MTVTDARQPRHTVGPPVSLEPVGREEVRALVAAGPRPELAGRVTLTTAAFSRIFPFFQRAMAEFEERARRYRNPDHPIAVQLRQMPRIPKPSREEYDASLASADAEIQSAKSRIVRARPPAAPALGFLIHSLCLRRATSTRSWKLRGPTTRTSTCAARSPSGSSRVPHRRRGRNTPRKRQVLTAPAPRAPPVRAEGG